MRWDAEQMAEGRPLLTRCVSPRRWLRDNILLAMCNITREVGGQRGNDTSLGKPGQRHGLQ